ncbi:cyclin-like protein [Sporormia fimetaria CBS 119925]|uniref:RNA polymerase II holoenzyme cyclin-like subunit n=1 Tax=Sporormia fimetaria CBS 119925 TaxID=1340428 RepID=A0A6A6VFL3_9PLEO|nr:cyclin-like protein [Sporormia fimetaria CBS 119925]
MSREVVRERPRPPPPAVAAEELQWIFSEEELLLAPSIVDGMSPQEERTLRKKGVNFIFQVGIMLKLPQTTLSTAAVFFNRYLMRNSLKVSPGYKPLHHYQIAATTLFLATKVEENCRKMKELVVACVRVALKDPNKLVDEQTKDFWKWRDTIQFNEDVILESLCFDLSVEPPFKIMYEMLKYYGLEHNKRLRNASWAFLSDSCLTPLCLLFTSRTIAAASLYAGARLADVELPNEDGKPWWEIQYVKLRDVRKACNMMVDLYNPIQGTSENAAIYVNLKSPDVIDMSFQTPQSLENGAPAPPRSEENVVPSTEIMDVDSKPVPEAATKPNEILNGERNSVAPDDGSEEGELDG